jgi:hypothetical protein
MELEGFLAKVGLSTSSLPSAKTACADYGAETEADLKMLFRKGTLESVGFNPMSAFKLNDYFENEVVQC